MLGSNLTFGVSSGDSYSAVGYNSSSPHPTQLEPLGVPFPGDTWTEPGRANWVGHLIRNYSPNPSLLIYDYAVGGDTVSGVEYQVRAHFQPTAAKKPDWAPWTADDSLFGIIRLI
jgi:hypothetical protein